MNTVYQKAFKEVLVILEQTQKSETKKIPSQFIELMQENASKNYEPKISNQKELKEQKLSKEAKAILSILYRRYILEEKEEIEFQEIMDKNIKFQEKKQEEKLWCVVVPKKENIFKRFFKRIKRLFKKEIF